jgi:hypothetical protein
MRLFVLALTALLVLLPSLLILFAPERPIRARLPWALAAFLSPLVTFGLVRMVPLLSNNAPEAAQWARFLGLLLSGGGFFLPWILFAIFLHRR